MEKKQKILRLETRKRIFDIINEQPGICIRELERTSGLAIGELTYHLPVLLKAELISEDKDGYFRRFFPYKINEKDRKVISTLRRDAAKRVVPLILEKKKITTDEVSKHLCISMQTARWHMNRMRKNGLVVEKNIEGGKFYLLKNEEAVRRIYLI